MATIGPFIRRTKIAYFTMEIALRPEMHTYSGGLGMLAGDTARSAADLEIPAIFVSLISRQGYLRQELDANGRQIEHPDPWDPSAHATPLRAKIAVEIENREVWIRPWLHVLACPMGHQVPVLLLDTDLDENQPLDRDITHYLYGGDQSYRLKQEVVLGIGGARILQALGFPIHTYHLNEGHAALAALDLLRRHRRPGAKASSDMMPLEASRVRELCIFTTHTPIEAGHDQFDYALVQQILGDYVDLDLLKSLAGADRMNMTRLALNLSGYVNGVAIRHAEVTTRMFPGYRVRAITNGVHPQTWAHQSIARLFEAQVSNWAHEPELLARSDQIDDESLWTAHGEAKAELIDLVKSLCGVNLEPSWPLIGFARRMTGYKRPDLLLADLDRLTQIHRRYPFQVVFAGKAHPRDEEGKRLIEQIHGHMRALSNTIPMAFLPNYDMNVARKLVAGADIWLNTPLPPLEASGTSGMKAALNGVLNLSVLDGWWLEACIDGTTGWAIGHDGGWGSAQTHPNDLYDKLEHVVLPLYHQDRARWIWMMKQSIGKIGYYFNSQRMMRRYATEAYLR